MGTKPFHFKQFTIIQEKSAMKVGTDGVLLGAWAQCENAQQILDIGTGTGLIALMLAQRSNAKITAIEIEKSAANEAYANFKNSPWSNRVSIANVSIQKFAENITQLFDLIVSNPPYFSQSKLAYTEARTLARHNDTLSILDLLTCVNSLLADNGIFNVIIPAENANKFIEAAERNHLFCTKKLWVKPTPEIAPKRVLLAFTKLAGNCIENTLVVESNGRHQYSTEYIELTKDFYLKL